jgi:hypothetical protein
MVRLAFIVLLFAFLTGTATPATAQTQQRLSDVRKIFVEQMGNNFDQYLVAALSKELEGRITVVTTAADADATFKGGSIGEAKGTPDTVARRVLGMDVTSGAISLISKDGKVVLWAGEAGDKSIFLVGARRTGQRKVAERLAKDLRKAMEGR